MEEKKKGGKRAAPNRRGWLLAVLVLAGLGIWGILEWRAHTAPGPGRYRQRGSPDPQRAVLPI